MKAPLQPRTASSHATIQRTSKLTSAITDNRPQAVTQRKLQETIASNPRQVVQQQAVMPFAARPNRTGLPDNLKTGVENLSGHSLDDVQVHYDSAKPAQLQAHAYAQGTAIYVGPGQEKHLPHETWHVVQQKQGRVRAIRQLKGVGVNDDSGLETEADIMGAKAIQLASTVTKPGRFPLRISGSTKVLQRNRVEQEEAETQEKKFVVKVNMPGSGDDLWRSRPKEKSGDRRDKPNQPTTPTAWSNEAQGKGKITWTIAGPGGPSTKGGGEKFNGVRDIGSNSIENNKKIIPIIVKHEIIKYREATANPLPVLVLIKAHSRNAVAATQVANNLHGEKDVKVELVAFDPVPGHAANEIDKTVDISKVPESTVIYSVASQYTTGSAFAPQRVLGAKRIIISRQDHGGGLNEGYKYGGKTYMGSQLNSLPRGIFVDHNKSGENKLELLKVDDYDNALHNMEYEFKESASLTRDIGRLKIIEDVLRYYFVNNKPPKNEIEHANTFGKKEGIRRRNVNTQD